LTLIAPVLINSNLVPVFQIIIFLIMVYQMTIAYRARKVYGTTSIIHIIAIMIMFVAALHDIRASHGGSSLLSLTPLANLFVVLVQTILLTREQGVVYRELARIETDMVQINATLKRFVPTNIFTILGISPEMIQLGMKKDCLFTVLSADIRGFTALSERMSPEMNYTFINRFLETVTPVISAHRGFINNFIGDAFIAVFPESPVDAVESAIEIQTIMNAGEQFSSFMLKETINVGIGIDFGQVTLGIQGGEVRMENTLQGVTVRSSARLEGLTKFTGASILISQRVYQAIPESLRDGRYLGRDYGLMATLKIHELYVGTDSADTKRKRRTFEAIESAVALIEQNELEQASTVLAMIPSEIARYDRAIQFLSDTIAMIQLDRSRN